MTEKKSVLYVDDEDMNLQILEMLLDSKFNLHKADSVESGFEILDKHAEIEVVLTDLNMPTMNGLEFAKIAKSKNNSRSFIVISAYMKTHEIQDAIEDGLIASYLSKPFDREKIISEIDKVLEKTNSI